jgi:signal transduction histidine kinase
MVETNVQLVINILIAYVLITTAIVTAIIGLVRYVSWSRPMRLIGEAARKIARGDFSVRIMPLRKDGKKDFVEVMFDDFNIMAAELESIETLKSDFIANVSHEIKTPLSVIQSYAAALQNGALSAGERREYTQTIVEASQKLSALVSNILKLNKLENQEIIPESRAFDLSEQLRRCALAFEDIWERKNITFSAGLDDITVTHDENMLEIAWNNLLSNAIKFTDDGSRISLGLKRADGFAVVVVQDSGCGMDEETQKRIFDKFYQGDSSHSQEGNGLGLAMVKKVIELQGGSIAVESAPGQGSTFTVYLKIQGNSA